MNSLRPHASLPLLAALALASMTASRASTQGTTVGGGSGQTGALDRPTLNILTEAPYDNFASSTSRDVRWQVSELSLGEDRNGDGDMLDELPVYHDISSGTTRIFDFAGNFEFYDKALSSGWVTMNLDERDEGGKDFNGDGDGLDRILRIFHPDTGAVVETDIGISKAFRVGDFALAGVTESLDGRDWDGDGLATDHAYVFVDPFSGEPVFTLAAGDRADMMITGDGVVVLALRESRLGGNQVDLTGDGDFDDDLPLVIDPTSGFSRVLPIPSSIKILLGKTGAYARVGEASWSRDLNGDGDTDDFEIVRVDAANGSVTPLGLPQQRNFDFISGSRISVGVQLFALEDGVVDFNGDGDFNDSVLHVYDEDTSQLINTRWATGFSAEIAPGLLALRVSESSQGANLNTDGDRDDFCYVLYDTTLRTSRVVPFAAGVGDARRLVGDDFVFVLDASRENTPFGGDLNGDGVSDEAVLHSFSLSASALTNLGLGMTYRGLGVELSATRSLALVDEMYDGVDRNGDGDVEDFSLSIVDLTSGRDAELGVTAFSVGETASPRNPNPLPYALLNERTEDVDFNGDGDAFDKFVALVGR